MTRTLAWRIARLRLCWLLALAAALIAPPAPLAAQPDDDPYLRNPRLGFAHISAAEGGTPDDRYRAALGLGAGWNRYPIYWDRVEAVEGEYDWALYDRQVSDDLRYGLSINAILLGRPAFYADGDRIRGVQQPIYADGSDYPGTGGKAFNPANPWVRFVDAAVRRYMPGGELAQAGQLPDGTGIRVWEIWNEPDYRAFWSASINEYARLLKISYIVIKQADPDAQVMFGGLLFSSDDNWLARVLAIYINDPLREQFNWYMDIVAVHSYANPWRTGWLVLNLRQTLIAYGIDKPIWVNETGVPVWDDYPGPVWARTPDERLKHATMQQQAWFTIQTAAYAWQEGADVIIYHQLYDDCGDQPPGTDFPPHNGALCAGGRACVGDAHGMIRNLPSSVCFSQHPQPGTERPAADAFRLLAQVFNHPFQRGRLIAIEGVRAAVVIEFWDTVGNQRTVVMWNRTFTPVTIDLPAVGRNAQLVTLGSQALITPGAGGAYTLDLPVALPDNTPDLPFASDAAIGGEPLILIERRDASLPPFVRYQPPHDLSAPLRVSLPPAGQVSAPPPAPRPTTDPAQDTRPPTARVNPLPPVSPPTFTVSWQGSDDSGIEAYVVWVRVDDGEWSVWLETADQQAQFDGEPGRTYEFDIWARDLAGNWSLNVDLRAQAFTRTQGE